MARKRKFSAEKIALCQEVWNRSGPTGVCRAAFFAELGVLANMERFGGQTHADSWEVGSAGSTSQRGASMASEIQPDQIRAYLGQDAQSRLQQYFGDGAAPSSFTGGSFERFSGGGDRPEVALRFTAEDIVAVSMLSVRIPGAAALEILETRAEALNELLAEVPLGLDLWDDAAEAAIAPGSSASLLWAELKAIDGSGWVTAGKLVARKRPRLIPVYDRVLRDAFHLSSGDGWWASLREVLRADPALVDEIVALRTSAGLDDSISVLRIIDVAVWMKDQGRPTPTPAEDGDS